MSVTTDGIKGYEYQYKVTVLIALTSEANKVELYVEKQGSEDALLKLEINGVESNIEIQVKREKSLIDINILVNWLCHFQERKHNNNLLQKLNDDGNCLTLFVTHSRCSDSLLQLRSNIFSFEKHHSISLDKIFFKEFKRALEEIKFVKHKKTELRSKREEFCKQQINLFNSKKDLESLLSQCFVYEELTDDKVDDCIFEILNKKYSIAQSRCNSVYLKLLEIVKEGRDNGTEISFPIKRYLESVRIGFPIIDNHYFKRIEESKLIKELEENGVLLLTGFSNCGKTELAKKISSYFVTEGFDYRVFDEMSELKRFLNSNISDNKVVILEDPFGHSLLKNDYLDIHHKVKDLISNKEKHHLIIISSRKELLSDIFESLDVSDYKTKNYQWNDLTIFDSNQVVSFWEFIARKKNVPLKIIDCVSNGISGSKNKNILQFGQLSYLANEELKLLENKDFNELEHIARRDSKDIAEDLKNKNIVAANILAISSICSDPIHELGFQDLAYILSNTSDLLSIRKKQRFIECFGNDEDPIFPKYSDDIVLDEETLDAISYLEERGLIIILSDNNSLLISHPNYYEAGRYLFFEKSSLKQQKKIDQFRRSISCLSPITSFLATRNYSFIYNKIKEDYKALILEIGVLGLDSIFPSVKDGSLIFSTKLFKELKPKQLDFVIHRIQDGGTDSFDIHWYNSIPFISDGGGFLDLITKCDLVIVKRAEESIIRGIKPNIYDAWIYINNLKKEKQVSQNDIRLLLQFDEGFVRQEVIYKTFLLFPEIIDVKLIEELFNDEHPSVVFSTIRASLLNWFSLSDNIQSLVKELSIEALSKSDVAIRAFNLISTFSIDYSDESVLSEDLDKAEKEIIWQVWGELFPVCIDNVPLDLRFNSARFSRTMEESMEFLDVKEGISVLNSWYKRIDYQLKNERRLDEFEMSIADILMQLTSTDSNARKELFSQLITYKDTNFILSNLNWIIVYWDKLDRFERDMIIKLINSNRTDVRWIKAILLTSNIPPKEIIKEILEDEDLFEKDAKEIVISFPETLIKDCLYVYCGFPQPLYWLGTHHKNEDFWLKIMRCILLNEHHVGFNICLKEFIYKGVNGGFRNEEIDFWNMICSVTKNKEILTNYLIISMVDCSCSIGITKSMWYALIKSYENLTKTDDLVKCILTNIDMILLKRSKDFFRVLDKVFLEETLIPVLALLNGCINEKNAKQREEELKKNIYFKLDNWIGLN
ncbi:hypothetical protein [Myroides odoratimimus]|uniref:nSTAND3 domain-containing NTPase n=1 Tax=Myroides odoratimimus TaxID=76832 RepID=UPI002578C07D|nr:hypothetical protein [Myroides odoratimimus]MDM1086715.1 hypothetical protein [Myroides odoratimimus]